MQFSRMQQPRASPHQQPLHQQHTAVLCGRLQTGLSLRYSPSSRFSVKRTHDTAAQWHARCRRHRCCPVQAVSAGSHAAAAPADDQVPPWRQVVAVTAGCLLLCNLHRSTFAVLLPDLSVQLGLTASQTGVVQASMLAAYLAGQVPAGWLADKYSGTRVLLWGLALWSVATACTAVAGWGVNSSSFNSAWPVAVIILSRVLMGLASACAMPCVTATAVEWVPTAERASMISFVYANFNVGGVIGLTMIPLLADILGGSGAFVVSGGIGVAWAFVGALVMQHMHARTSTKSLHPNEQQQPATQQQNKGLEPEQQQQALTPQQLSAKEQLSWNLDSASKKQVALLCFAHAVIGYGFFLLQNWMPLYVASLGSQGLAVTGRLSSMPWLAGAVVGMMAGSAADGAIRHGLPTLFVRQLMQFVSFLGCGLSVIPLALSPNPGLIPAVLCLTANLTFYSLSYGGFHAYLQDVCGRYAGVLQGVTNSASILMGIFGNLLTGVVVDATASYAGVFCLLTVMYVGAAGAWCLFTSSYQLRAVDKQAQC